MDSDQSVKVCPLCAEPIRAAAKVCPFCRSPQTRLARWLRYLPLGISTLLLVVFVGLACTWLFPDAFHSEGRSFVPYRAELVVARTSLELDPRKSEFWLTGYITNTGRFPWRVRELEVRFMQGETKLVDVRHPDISEAFVVQPNMERAFRVELGHLAFTNRAIVTMVRVYAATDGNLPAKTD